MMGPATDAQAGAAWHTGGMGDVLVLLVAFAVGAVPFSYLVAHSVAGTDLREVGTGTVSGTSLYRVAGLAPLLVGGILDVLKGLPGPMLAGGDEPVLAAFAAGAAVAGHNWSPYIGGAGGRGIAPALGVFLVIQWQASVVLLFGLALGRVVRQTGLATFVTILVLPFFLLRFAGGYEALAGFLVMIPIFVKRMLGNAPPAPEPNRSRVLTHRLLFDNDG